MSTVSGCFGKKHDGAIADARQLGEALGSISGSMERMEDTEKTAPDLVTKAAIEALERRVRTLTIVVAAALAVCILREM